MQRQKTYRPNVAAVILSSKYPDKCEFFVAHRSDIKMHGNSLKVG